MEEKELKEKMDKDLEEVFNVKSIIDFQFDLVQKAYVKGLELGLKVGSLQWHDLQKDLNDLPKKDCEVVTLHENGNKNIQKWENGNWTNAIVIPVIKWCEIPKYEKE